jgi:hypothetical protein
LEDQDLVTVETMYISFLQMFALLLGMTTLFQMVAAVPITSSTSDETSETEVDQNPDTNFAADPPKNNHATGKSIMHAAGVVGTGTLLGLTAYGVYESTRDHFASTPEQYQERARHYEAMKGLKADRKERLGGKSLGERLKLFKEWRTPIPKAV